MKTTELLTLGVAASLSLGALALADQTGAQANKKIENQSRVIEKSKKTWDDQPVVIRTVGYPFVFLERAGHSIIRTPQIVEQTYDGDRTLISKEGILAPRESEREDMPRAAR